MAREHTDTDEEPPSTVGAIVVPLDGSTFAARALPVASWLADRLDAEIHLLSAVAKEDAVSEREGQLAAVDLPGRRVRRSVVIDPDPADAVHEAVRRFPDGVVCMASHGRGRSAALVGSVATEVVARGHDPVIVVGPLVNEELGGSGVVACADETPQSASLVRLALGWARLLGEPMTVITVAEPVPPPPREGHVHRLFGPDGDVEAYLESLVAPVRAEAPDIKTEVVYDPVGPADGVRSYLEDHPAALVVMRAHARTGLARIVFGRVAAGIVHGGVSPVLVIPRSDAG